MIGAWLDAGHYLTFAEHDIWSDTFSLNAFIETSHCGTDEISKYIEVIGQPGLGTAALSQKKPETYLKTWILQYLAVMAAPVIATGRRTNAGMDLPKSCKKKYYTCLWSLVNNIRSEFPEFVASLAAVIARCDTCCISMPHHKKNRFHWDHSGVGKCPILGILDITL